MIRDEDGLLTGYVFVDVADRDISSYVDEASRVVRGQVKLPPGYAVLWSGQYEAMARVRARHTYIIPFTVFLVFVLLYLNTRSLAKTAIVQHGGTLAYQSTPGVGTIVTIALPVELPEQERTTCPRC